VAAILAHPWTDAPLPQRYALAAQRLATDQRSLERADAARAPPHAHGGAAGGGGGETSAAAEDAAGEGAFERLMDLACKPWSPGSASYSLLSADAIRASTAEMFEHAAREKPPALAAAAGGSGGGGGGTPPRYPPLPPALEDVTDE